MKTWLKRIGILAVIAGVIILAYSEFSNTESNNMLIFSGGLIVVGLVAYVIINNIVD
jgi:uncharacterized membrane protein